MGFGYNYTLFRDDLFNNVVFMLLLLVGQICIPDCGKHHNNSFSFFNFCDTPINIIAGILVIICVNHSCQTIKGKYYIKVGIYITELTSTLLKVISAKLIHLVYKSDVADMYLIIKKNDQYLIFS